MSDSSRCRRRSSGWVMPLAEVPDPVFAGGMMGEGVAIDPTDDRAAGALRRRDRLGCADALTP